MLVNLYKVKRLSNQLNVLLLVSICNVEFRIGVLSYSVLLVLPGAFLVERLLVMEIQSVRSVMLKETLNQVVPWLLFLE